MIRIGTRGSDLALWQARHIAAELQRITGEEPQIIIVKTSGDRIQDVALTPDLGRGFFTKEIEEGLLAGEFDLAVHSLKDLAVEMPPGLCLAAVTQRAAAGETLLGRPGAWDSDASFVPLVSGARVGTSSPRRRRLLLHHRPDLRIEQLRGNVPTRVRKLQEGAYDAVLLARAGLERLRLDLFGLCRRDLSLRDFPGAPGQGALGLQARAGDHRLLEIVAQLEDARTRAETGVERGLLAALGGGCSLPLAAWCSTLAPSRLHLQAFLFHPEADLRPLAVDCEGSDPDRLVAEAAAALLPVLEQPLVGLSVIVLAGQRETSLAQSLSAAGAAAHAVACYEAVPVVPSQVDLAWIATADHLLIASASAIHYLLVHLMAGGRALAADTTLLVPGASTAHEVAATCPDHAVLVADPPRSDGMGALAASRGARRVAAIGAEGGSTEGVDRCREHGVEARQFPVYRLVARPDIDAQLADLPAGDVALYMSPKAVECCPPARLAGITAWIAVGPTTAAALGNSTSGPVHTLPRPDLSAFLELVRNLPGLGPTPSQT